MKPPTQESTLHRGEVFIERKTFIMMKDNPRGRFLRIVEDVGTNRRPASIVIPSTGLREVQKILADMIKADSEIPAKGDAAPLP